MIKPFKLNISDKALQEIYTKVKNLMKTIPFSSPDIQNSDLKAVEAVIRSGWLAHGDYSKRLEQLFCDYTGAKYATTVSNCTAGLHLSCLAARFGPGDEVIVPAQTHTATAHAVEFTGAKARLQPIHHSQRIELSNQMLLRKQ